MLNLYCFIVIADDKDFYSQCIVSVVLKLGSFDERNEFIKLMQDKIEFNKTFNERNIRLAMQFETRNSHSLLSYHQPAVLWRLF